MDFSERKSLFGALWFACDWLRVCYGDFREENGVPQERADEKGGSVARPQRRAEEKSEIQGKRNVAGRAKQDPCPASNASRLLRDLR